MKYFDIWIEGHAVTGEKGTAHQICTSDGEDFNEACHNAWIDGKFEGYGQFDGYRLTLWGCRLFDNEDDARQSFG